MQRQTQPRWRPQGDRVVMEPSLPVTIRSRGQHPAMSGRTRRPRMGRCDSAHGRDCTRFLNIMPNAAPVKPSLR